MIVVCFVRRSRRGRQGQQRNVWGGYCGATDFLTAQMHGTAPMTGSSRRGDRYNRVRLRTWVCFRAKGNTHGVLFFGGVVEFHALDCGIVKKNLRIPSPARPCAPSVFDAGTGTRPGVCVLVTMCVYVFN